ncbi:hypothetical protein Q5741_07920 [Paenibacillus sp. JX-17]|uniref:DUF4367 domain-containing protein n=1 Tax=Paenibacillus lacisoli TaxID=3064525 RepID=A0ABT9CAQ5_9BACL|nr:hypothetical protein [Paenibacillus sp. JX-17]MDO7906344.1 hypothetical protein [Paenibacillus sp. JX-17]
MLPFEQKITILESYPQLQRKNVSLGRVNFHYEDSAYDKKTVAYHLHPNGNGFIYAGLLGGYPADDKGMVNIRNYSEPQLRELIEASIASLSPSGSTAAIKGDAPVLTAAMEDLGNTMIEQQEAAIWTDEEGNELSLVYGSDENLWYIYAGDNLELAVETLEEAEEYLQEEGFAPQG